MELKLLFISTSTYLFIYLLTTACIKLDLICICFSQRQRILYLLLFSEELADGPRQFMDTFQNMLHSPLLRSKQWSFMIKKNIRKKFKNLFLFLKVVDFKNNKPFILVDISLELLTVDFVNLNFIWKLNFSLKCCDCLRFWGICQYFDPGFQDTSDT